MHRPIRAPQDFLIFGSPLIGQEEIDEVVASMKAGWLGTGPKVARFEADFRAYKGSAHAVAVNSCTAALHLAILVSGVGPGDEVITTPLTFCATVNAIIHAGGTPVLADIDPATMNIDPARVEAAVTPRTRAIVPVHFAGYPCDMDALGAIADRRGLRIIEDCAHAIEAERRGRKTGTFGGIGCFSFYATKNLSTGEGGMLITEDAGDAARLKTLALHGMSADAWSRFSDEGYKHYQVTEAGFKYNMMDLQAAIGIHQLRRLEENWSRRLRVWERYDRAFAGLGVGLPARPGPEGRHALHLYTLRIDARRVGIDRDGFLAAMHRHNIGTGVHYLSIPEHPYYRRAFGWKPEDHPRAMEVGRQTVSLPLSPKLSDQDVDDVILAVRTVLADGR